MRFILGSNSPRRREILSYFSLPFEQISPSFDEEAFPVHENPEVYAKDLAKGKALSLQTLYPEAVILCADTVVNCAGKYYGKPANEKEAFKTLEELAGKWHSVFTGVAVAHPKGIETLAEETKVEFNPLDNDQIYKYLNALHWADKAGGYTVQLAGSLLVRRIEGCYYNVLGLPIHTVQLLLSKIGINLWDYLK